MIKACGKKYYQTLILYMSALFVFLLCTSGAFADNLIVGGKRIGPVVLGDPIAKYEKFLGPRKIISSTLYEYPKRKIAVLVKNGSIEGIFTYSPAYKTREGVQVGQSVKVLKKKYGNYLKTNEGALVYSESGLAFNEKDYKISRIMVIYSKPDVLLGDKKIVPGSRVGNIKLGMEIEQIIRYWGQPSSMEDIPGRKEFSQYKYGHKAMTIIVESGIVAGVRVLSYKYQTPEGLGINSTQAQVIKTYGKKFKEVKNSISYGSLGIGFYFHKGKVMEILLSPRTE